jgi:hypothetical protein
MRAVPLLLALLLAGCASGVPVERQVTVQGGHFQDVQGEAALLVRTFLPEQDGQRLEVVGARCDVVSSLYTTELVTPSRLVVPNFGPQSPELSFTCRAGERTGTAVVRIATYWRSPPGYWGAYPGWGYPGYGGWGYGGWGYGGWGYGGGYPYSDYPDIRVILH